MNIPTDLRDRLVISVEEVAARTGWSERSLTEECRADRIDHVHRKGSYGFTPEQLDALIARYTRAGTGGPLTEAEREADELEAARQFNAGRTSSGQAAA